MSVGKRAYNIMRGYIGREWERIKDLDRTNAESELEEAIGDPLLGRETADTSARPSQIESSGFDAKARARQLLGVGPDDDFTAIRKAFERLNKRSDPNKFPEGSVEREQATEIRKRIQWAYQQLTAEVDVTEKRFRSLEID